jgi:molybdate transport system substrate-binding protein
MTESLVLLSGGAAMGLVSALERDFTAATGVGIDGTFGAVGAMRDKLLGGGSADFVILTPPTLDELAHAGRILRDSLTPIGDVATSVAVRAGTAPPDIATAEGLSTALLAADEIYFPDPALATAGIHFQKVLRSLGVADEVAENLRPFPNGAKAMAALAASTARNPIGCTQITEILITPGVTPVGPLPASHALVTTYVAAVCAGTAMEAPARTFIAALAAPSALNARREAGFTEVAHR